MLCFYLIFLVLLFTDQDVDGKRYRMKNKYKPKHTSTETIKSHEFPYKKFPYLLHYLWKKKPCKPDPITLTQCYNETLETCQAVQDSDCSSGGTFGINDANSYWVYHTEQFGLTENDDFRLNLIGFDAEISFKTDASDGILFYIENSPSTSDAVKDDFIGAFIENGKVVFATVTNGDTKGLAKTVSNQTYNDGNWHHARFEKRGDFVTVCVDEVSAPPGDCASATVPSGTTSGQTNVSPWIYVGGTQCTVHRKIENYVDITEGFVGCLTNFTVEGQAANGEPCESHNVY